MIKIIVTYIKNAAGIIFSVIGAVISMLFESPFGTPYKGFGQSKTKYEKKSIIVRAAPNALSNKGSKSRKVKSYWKRYRSLPTRLR